MSLVRAPSFVFSDAVNLPRIFVSVILNMITSNATFDRNLACNENLSYNFVHSFIKNVTFVSPISIGVKFQNSGFWMQALIYYFEIFLSTVLLFVPLNIKRASQTLKQYLCRTSRVEKKTEPPFSNFLKQKVQEKETRKRKKKKELHYFVKRKS